MGSKGKRWKLSASAVRNKAFKCGELKEKTEQIRELPEIGTRVVVHECIVYTHQYEFDNIVTAYKPSSRFYDVWGYPAVFTVASYTRGRENALDKKNQILLERECRGGYVMRESVSALEAAIGVILLQEIESEEDMEAFNISQIYFGYKQAIVRETTESLKEAMIKKREMAHEKAG